MSDTLRCRQIILEDDAGQPRFFVGLVEGGLAISAYDDAGEPGLFLSIGAGQIAAGYVKSEQVNLGNGQHRTHRNWQPWHFGAARTLENFRERAGMLAEKLRKVLREAQAPPVASTSRAGETAGRR